MNTRWLNSTPLRLLWCLCGGAGGLALSLLLAGPAVNPFLLASLGGTAVFLFGLTQAPAAQPRALCWMLLTRTVHPPAGANPILMIHVHAGWSALWQPVLVGAGTLALVAMVWSRLYPGLKHYPLAPWMPNPVHPTWGGWGD